MGIDVQTIDSQRHELKRRDLEILYELLQQHSWAGRLLSFSKGTEEYDTVFTFERVFIGDHDFESIPCITLETNTCLTFDITHDHRWCLGSSQEIIIGLDSNQSKELQLILTIRKCK